jgi:two-component system sensor histidine kinase KdpD
MATSTLNTTGQSGWRDTQSAPGGGARTLVGYGVALLGVAGAALAAFLAEHLVSAPNLALIFVIPVLGAAFLYGWRASSLAAVAAVLTYDYLFVPPLFSLRVGSPSDMWALLLLVIVAAIASAVAAYSRRQAVHASEEIDRTEALRGLAHSVTEGAPSAAVIVAASQALGRIFQAPAVVLLERDGDLGAKAQAEGAVLSDHDKEAARWALAQGLATRAGTFPFDAATYEFWPVRVPGGHGAVLGVGPSSRRDGRLPNAERYFELVGGYLVVGLSKRRD